MNHNFVRSTYYSGIRNYYPNNDYVDIPFPEVPIANSRKEVDDLLKLTVAGILLYALLK